MSFSQQYARLVGSFLQESLSDMIRIETMEDDHTIVTKDGAMMSMIALEGALCTPDDAEVAKTVSYTHLTLPTNREV